MPTKRARTARTQAPQFSPTLLYHATDGLWGANEKPVERFFDHRFSTDRREVWEAIRDEFMPEWIKAHPGTRPTWWYLFDAPRIADDEVHRYGWTACWFVKELPDLRQRLGGVGDPQFEHFNVVPRLPHGRPIDFIQPDDLEDAPDAIPFDPSEPPQYESQASYLKRHGLLTPEEKRRLRKKDYKPEIVRPEPTSTRRAGALESHSGAAGHA